MKIFDGLSSRQRLLVIVAIIVIIPFILLFWTGGFLITTLFTLFILAILFITKSVWLSDNYGTLLIRRISLWVILATAGSFSIWNNFILTALLQPALNHLEVYFPFFSAVELPVSSPSMLILVFVLIGVLIVNYFMRDTTGMGIHPVPIDKDFPEPTYKKRLEAFCRVLSNNINELNRETNWSEEYFVPLDAEVEVRSKTTSIKKIESLLTALKTDRKSKVILILGDPGAGKSVALRKLCSDLLAEVNVTGKVPIYINLREWDVEQKWDANNVPSVTQLHDFVLLNLRNRCDAFANEFIDKYYKKMFEHGRLFFILDSFDEIPSVMDVEESSWLIDKLSSVIYNFLAGATDSRGLLASRIYRKPTEYFNARTELTIRPFSEDKILERFKKSLDYDTKIEKLIFTERQEFITLARNPFTASLILNYAKKHNYTLPEKRAELYLSYIEERLEIFKKHYPERIKYSNQDILKCIQEVAYFMFNNQNYGLEAPINELKANFTTYDIDHIIELLLYVRLGRLGAGEKRLFSFVHRRFNEYLVACKLIELPELVPKESIPTDSRWRDSLVLYAEIVEYANAKELAEFCWKEIDKIKDQELELANQASYLRAIHALRFINDAFRTRLDVIASFRSELSAFVVKNIDEANLLVTKLCIEAVNIIDTDKIDKCLVYGFSLRLDWISDTALKSCRYLTNISKDLEKRIIRYIISISAFDLIKRKKEFIFSFSLSESFKFLKTIVHIRILEVYLTIIITIISLFISNVNSIFMFIFSVLLLRLYIEYLTKGKKFLINFFFFFRFLLFYLLVSNCIHSQSANHENWSNVTFVKVNDLLKILLGILIFPYLDTFFIILFPERIKKKFWIAIIAIPIIMYFLYKIIPPIISLLKEYPMIIYALVTLGAIGFLYEVSSSIYSFYKDFTLIKSIRSTKEIYRTDLASTLSKFKTAWVRKMYMNIIRERKIILKGDWKENVMPNYYDEASTILAQLEEKNFGFIR